MRATHVEAPALDASERYPDLYGEEEPEPEPEEERRLGRAGARAAEPEPESRSEPEQEELTPMGNRRSAVTEADDYDYRCRSRRFLKRSNGAQKVDTKGIERTGAQLVEALSHFKRRGARDRHRHRPARDALRAAPGARHQDVEGRPAQGRPRLRARRRAGAHPRPDPRQAGGRRRGAQPGAQDGAPRRRLPGRAQGLVAAVGLARQGHRRQGDRHRPRQAAAHPDRRHHRLRQVGLRERDAVVAPAARRPQRGAAGAGRPQARGAEPLRGHPAPAHAGRHEPAPGRQRARQPDQGDGGALRRDEQGQDAQPGRAQPRARAARASARCPTSSA